MTRTYHILEKPIPVVGTKLYPFDMDDEELNNLKENEVWLHDLIDASKEDIEKFTKASKIRYHRADDWRTADLADDSGHIRESCDGNGYAFIFFNDGDCLLVSNPWFLYDEWNGLKVSENSSRIKELPEEDIIAKGSWRYTKNKKRQIALTIIYTYE